MSSLSRNMSRTVFGLTSTVVGSIVATWTAIVWATVPPPRFELLEPRQPEPRQPSSDEEASSPDLSGFASSIWNAQPEPVVAVASPPSPAPPPRVRLELLGIARTFRTEDTMTLEAVLYDPDLDEILYWAEGEGNSTVTCSHVTEDRVELLAGTRTLTLRVDLLENDL